jgi:hypothetical protein
MSRKSSSGIAAVTVAFLAATFAVAQEDLTLPPKIVDVGRPGQARLADPPVPAAKPPEEIVVKGTDNPWRLPDLGSAWRAEHDTETRATSRMRMDLFPLWDPEAARPERDLLPLNSELRRVGFIEVFRVRFGRRR